MVNFHGSSSFGQAWVESILGAHPDKPFTDVMKATDHLIAQGYVDPARMAAAGGSYGGFLVNWIAGHTDRFKALVSHAGVYSLLGQSASDTSYGRQHSYGGYPFTNLANVEKWSPNRFAAGFKTPDAGPARRARLPRAGRRRASSSTACSRPRACPPASSTTPTRTTGS